MLFIYIDTHTHKQLLVIYGQVMSLNEGNQLSWGFNLSYCTPLSSSFTYLK
jgi:hypothetical protein